jgi:hypothetical protein
VSTINEGDTVVHSITRTQGVVIKAGPYGDQPFQVQTAGGIYSFINDDGTSPYRPGRWEAARDTRKEQP